MSYGGDPSASSIDAIRFLIGDTASTVLLNDAEITYLKGRCDPIYGDDLMTAAFAAEMIATKYANEISISADGVSYSGQQLQDKFREVAGDLRARYKALASIGGAPVAGGIDRNSLPEPGVKPTTFGLGIHDNDRAGSESYGYRGENFDGDAYYEPDGWLP